MSRTQLGWSAHRSARLAVVRRTVRAWAVTLHALAATVTKGVLDDLHLEPNPWQPCRLDRFNDPQSIPALISSFEGSPYRFETESVQRYSVAPIAVVFDANCY